MHLDRQAKKYRAWPSSSELKINMMDVQILGAWVVTQNEKREILKTNIGIQDGRILCMGSDTINARTVFREDHALIVPAYHNLHLHFGEYYLRGIPAPNTEAYILMGEKFHQALGSHAGQVRRSSIRNTLYESMLHGTLTVFGMRGWPHVSEFPVYAYLGYPLMKSEKLQSYIDNFEDQFAALPCNFADEYFIAIHSLKWVDRKLLQELMRFREKNPQIKFSLHAAETSSEIDYIRREYQCTPIQLLDSCGLLDKNTLLVHCNYLSQEDITLIRKGGCTVAVCHNSNLKLGNKPCGLESLLAADINVVLGSDGPATSDSLSMLDSMKITALLSGLEEQKIFDMATINPAKYLGRQTGRIAEGMAADLLFYDRRELAFTYPQSAVHNLMYNTAVRPYKVMKAGEVIIDRYEFLNTDFQTILPEKAETLEGLASLINWNQITGDNHDKD
ncbi:MAG: amidohydrolase family protein [Treponema sp.]|nr:amidohydrolase family protein [Treponema sp.]